MGEFFTNASRFSCSNPYTFPDKYYHSSTGCQRLQWRYRFKHIRIHKHQVGVEDRLAPSPYSSSFFIDIWVFKDLLKPWPYHGYSRHRCACKWIYARRSVNAGVPLLSMATWTLTICTHIAIVQEIVSYHTYHLLLFAAGSPYIQHNCGISLGSQNSLVCWSMHPAGYCLP